MFTEILDKNKIKMLFSMLDKNDKVIIAELIYKYRERLNFSVEDIKEMVKMKGLNLSSTIKEIINNQINNYSEDDLKKGISEFIKQFDSNDLEKIERLSIIPENIKKIIRDAI